MHHDLTLINTLATAFGLSLVLGYLAQRLKLPALVGYLIAGIAIGPFTPGYVADMALANQLAEIGVMLLMFGVGLHFSFQDLASVRRIAVPGAFAQIAVATALGAFAAHSWGWSLAGGLVFGLALSVASTVVLLRGLEEQGKLDSLHGRIAVGWLVVEDLIMVLVLVLIPPLAAAVGADPDPTGLPVVSEVPEIPEIPDEHGNVAWPLTLTFGKVGLFVILMLFLGRRLFPWLLMQVARTGTRELFTLAVIAAAIGIAFGAAELFGVSFALGAFFAGMVLRESPLSFRAAQDSLPLREAFSVLFFVAVGMLFDPKILVERPVQVLLVVAIILVGKSAAAFLIVALFRYPLRTALTVSASLAQIGEFSFILAGLGVTLDLIPEEAYGLILAGALLSIAINPFLFMAIEPLHRLLRRRSGPFFASQSGDRLGSLPPEVLPSQVTGHVVLAGFGRMGKILAERLAEDGIPFVVADQNRELVDQLRANGHKAVAGDAAEPDILVQAHVARARVLVLLLPDEFGLRKSAETARALNPDIEILVRAHGEESATALQREKAGKVFWGEQALAENLARRIAELAG